MYGVTGSGKTTLAWRISEATGIAWHSVDELTWLPGWVAVTDDEQRRRVGAICAGPEWILDTAYGSWLDVPLARAELIVALDYPRWFSLQRLVRRTARRLINRGMICNGNRESLRGTFSRRSIILWHCHNFADKRARIRQWASDPARPALVHLRTRRQTGRWLSQLGRLGY